MITTTHGTLRIAYGNPPRDNTAWKNKLGNHPATARFALLPETKRRWRTFGASFVLQCLLAMLLVTVPMLFPQRLAPIMHYEVVSVLTQPREVPLPPKQPAMRVKPQPRPAIPAEPPKIAKLIAPPQPVAPKPKPKEMPAPVTPKLDPVFEVVKLEGPRNEPRRPRPDVKVGAVSTGSAAPATVVKNLAEVQTGGFGDPNGVPAKGDPNKRATIARQGSFDLPPGPGYGNGTGGSSGVRGTVASAGFGNGVALPDNKSGQGGRGVVRAGGFADASATVEGPKKTATATSTPSVQPVEILAKPNPVYTQEARDLRIEGEVLLEVVFGATGDVRVIRVLRGLGHGLDEAAIHAAQKIQYKPARHDGQPVDFSATVHIVFQLAY